MTPQPAAGHSISAWRDYDETAVTLREGMSLGSWALTARSSISAAKLEPGAPADQVPARILGELSAQRLVGRVGDVAWWLPYQVRRWPVIHRGK